MKRIFKRDRKYLVPGAKILRVIRYDTGGRSETEITVARGPYFKYCSTFDRDCEFIDIKGRIYPDRNTDYFVSDLFNGEIYLLAPQSILPDELFEIEI